MTLLGRTEACSRGVMRFAPDLLQNLGKGDSNLLSVLDDADAYVARNGLELPEEPQARRTVPDADCVKNPILSLDLVGAGIATIIWATGFTTDYSWLNVDTFDEKGRPRHQRGVSAEPGIYFLGLPWHHGEDRASSGACGTMPSISRTRSPSSATIWPITKRIPPTMTRCKSPIFATAKPCTAQWASTSKACIRFQRASWSRRWPDPSGWSKSTARPLFRTERRSKRRSERKLIP
jgi:hypothetical protein